MTSAKAMKRFVMTEYKFPHYRNLESQPFIHYAMLEVIFSSPYWSARKSRCGFSITPIEAALAIRGPYVS